VLWISYRLALTAYNRLTLKEATSNRD